MVRQSISFTEPNDKWLKEQIEIKEYSSKSDLVNDLIRQAISGFTNDTKDQILEQARKNVNV